MFDSKAFPFDVTKMTEYFSNNDMFKTWQNMNVPGYKPEQFMEAQRKNMEALVEANKAAAAGYQDLFQKQVKLFEETMKEAQDKFGKFDASQSLNAEKQAEAMRLAFEKGVANMTELAETAQKANREAYDIVSARVQESINEIQKTVGEATKTAQANTEKAVNAATKK
ncbi:phasin family protein [Paracoccaceae bacterium GXU_MW_L88]